MTRRAVPDPKTYAALTRDTLAAARAALTKAERAWVMGRMDYSTWSAARGEVLRLERDAKAKEVERGEETR